MTLHLHFTPQSGASCLASSVDYSHIQSEWRSRLIASKNSAPCKNESKIDGEMRHSEIAVAVNEFCQYATTNRRTARTKQCKHAAQTMSERLTVMVVRTKFGAPVLGVGGLLRLLG